MKNREYIGQRAYYIATLQRLQREARTYAQKAPRAQSYRLAALDEALSASLEGRRTTQRRRKKKITLA